MKGEGQNVREQHLWVETCRGVSNAELQLANIPTTLLLDNKNTIYHLRNMVVFKPLMSNVPRGIGHYFAVAHRGNRIWEIHDDLSSSLELEHMRNSNKVLAQFIFNSIQIKSS